MIHKIGYTKPSMARYEWRKKIFMRLSILPKKKKLREVKGEDGGEE
jgi:hypothetical protein